MSERTINVAQQLGEKCPYLSIRDFAKQYSTWTESSIRWLIYTNTAGFNESVVRRVGKSKILLSVEDFWKWIEAQNQNKNVKVLQMTAINSNTQPNTVRMPLEVYQKGIFTFFN